MVLGTLASGGPQHGHQIRRTAEVTNVGEWGGVSVGALYRELRQMAVEGLVAEVRTEQVGRRPARTIYAIADSGRLELAMLREHAIKDRHAPPDPLSVALIFSGEGDDPASFADWMTARRDFLRLALRELAAERERLTSRGYINALQSLSMRRGELGIEAELIWHDEMDGLLATARPGELAAVPPALDEAGPAQPKAGLAPLSSADSDPA
jgi:DNA-binding PadR family transcriptional regulator